MHQLLPLKIKLASVIGLAFLVSYGAAATFGEPVKIATIVGLVEAIIIYGFAYSWPLTTKLPWPFPAWMRTDISGTWEGTIRTRWQGPKHQQIEPIPVSFDIRQSWLKTTFLATTSKMVTSDVMNAVPTFDAHTGVLEFRYFYRTRPEVAVAEENPAQSLGAALAVIDTSNPDRMKIMYTNERGLGGDIKLDRKLA